MFWLLKQMYLPSPPGSSVSSCWSPFSHQSLLTRVSRKNKKEVTIILVKISNFMMCCLKHLKDLLWKGFPDLEFCAVSRAKQAAMKYWFTIQSNKLPTGEIMTEKRNPYYFTLPSGHVDLGEGLQDFFLLHRIFLQLGLCRNNRPVCCNTHINRLTTHTQI